MSKDMEEIQVAANCATLYKHSFQKRKSLNSIAAYFWPVWYQCIAISRVLPGGPSLTFLCSLQHYTNKRCR